MRLLDFLTERDTHWYGWIDHTGQFEPGYHGKVVALNFGDDIQAEHGPLDLIKQVGEEHYRYAFEHGWIRVYQIGQELGFQFYKTASKVAIQKMIWIIDHFDDPRNIVLEFADKVGQDTRIEWAKSSQEAKRIINQWIRGTLREGVQIPDTDYGYWITHHGEFLEVPYEGHAHVAQRYFRRHPEEWEVPGKLRPTGYERAFELGWIRIIERGGVGFGVRDPHLSRAETLRAVLSYIRQIHPDHKLFLDLGYTAPKPTFKDNYYPTKQELSKYFMRFLMGKRRLQMVAEAQIPETDYGYWITHLGEMIPVTREAHEEKAERYFRQHPEAGNPDLDALYRAYDLGWIRILDQWGYTVTNAMAGRPDEKENIINIRVDDPSKITREALNMMLGYLAQTDARRYYMDVYNRAQPFKRRSKADIVNFFKRLFFRTKKQQMVAEGKNLIPQTDYGYWITEEGKYIPVTYQGHQDEAMNHFSRNTQMGLAQWGNAAAFKQGWIKVERTHNLHIDLFPRYVTKQALYALLELAKQVQPNHIYLDLLGANDLHDPLQQLDLPRFNQIIRTILQMRRIAA